jgi:hypothetical protein
MSSKDPCVKTLVPHHGAVGKWWIHKETEFSKRLDNWEYALKKLAVSSVFCSVSDSSCG